MNLPLLLVVLSFAVQEGIQDLSPMGGPISLERVQETSLLPITARIGGLNLSYSLEGAGGPAGGPVIPLDPFTAFLRCFHGPGVTGVQFVDGRPVVRDGAYVFWVHRQTIENAAEVLVCRDWDWNRDYDVDMRDVAEFQRRAGREW